MNCRQPDCKEIPTHKVYWPSETSLACKEHALMAQRIANSEDIYIQIEELDNDSARESQSSSQDSKGEVY